MRRAEEKRFPYNRTIIGNMTFVSFSNNKKCIEHIACTMYTLHISYRFRCSDDMKWVGGRATERASERADIG